MPPGAAASAPGTPRAAPGSPAPRAAGGSTTVDGGGDPLQLPGADPWAKRPRTTDGGGERGAAQLDAKLATVKAEVIANFGEQLKGPLAAVVAQQASQNAQFRGDISELQTSAQRLEESNKQIREQLADMRKQLHMQEAQIPIKDYEGLLEWDRDADTSIIVGTAAENFTAEKFKESIQPIMDRCELEPDQWSIQGKSPARRFVVQFSGQASAAARKVRAFYAKLKQVDGSWLQTEVANVHGQTSRLYLGLDRSAKSARCEFQYKKLAQFGREHAPDKRWRADRQQGVIYCNNMAVVSVVVGATRETPSRVLFNYDGCSTHSINRDAIKQSFEEFFKTTLEERESISFTAWNARALLCNNFMQRRRKLQCMSEALRSTSLLALQEVHGSHHELQHAVHLAHIEASIFSSIPERGAGGVAIIAPGLPQSIADDESRFTHTELVPGRAQRLLIKTMSESEAAQGALPNMVVIYNVHNFRLTAQEVDKVAGSIRAEVITASQQPERIAILVMGDFNFMDEAPLEMKAPLVNKSLPRLRRHNPEHQLAWESVLTNMTELDPEIPTHYTEQSQQCTRIDKIYISTPPWMPLQWCARADVPLAPEVLYDRGPVHLRFAHRQQEENGQLQPIPMYIFEHPLFEHYLGTLM
ncbi:unnamed protein product, partial [Prorocentrum cordatum]